MVIVRLMGGLGNQMFQYAAARRLALEQGVPLKLDVSWFAGSRERAYALGGLNVEAAFATTAELDGIIGSSSRGRRARALSTLKRHLLIGQGWTWIYEHRLSPYNRRVQRARGRVYLDGYWQSERYFVPVAETIRRDFTVIARPDGSGREIADRIATTESVSVHVRRGDYVSDPQTSPARSVCTPDYYRRCALRAAEGLANPHLFLFSDDPEWVEANLRFECPTTVVSRTAPGGIYADLQLMSACRRHIIANSSFSWWAAWLDPRPDKVVLAPRRWMYDARVDDRDVLPAAWIRM